LRNLHEIALLFEFSCDFSKSCFESLRTKTNTFSWAISRIINFEWFFGLEEEVLALIMTLLNTANLLPRLNCYSFKSELCWSVQIKYV